VSESRDLPATEFATLKQVREFVAALEMRMEIVVAIELIVGAVFVVWFWHKNPELILSRRLSPLLLDPYDDEENDDARVHPSNVM
jgi:hypothetical protein